MALACAICGGELRPTAITAEGTTQACPCGRTQLTISSKGMLATGALSTTKGS